MALLVDPKVSLVSRVKKCRETNFLVIGSSFSFTSCLVQSYKAFDNLFALHSSSFA